MAPPRPPRNRCHCDPPSREPGAPRATIRVVTPAPRRCHTPAIPSKEEGSMKADALIRWFMPREERFHELLAQDTANLLAAARLFAEVAASSGLAERRGLGAPAKARERP